MQSTASPSTRQRNKLTTERERIRRRAKVRQKQMRTDEERLSRIADELQRLDLLELVGKTNAVKVRYRQPFGTKCYHLNDLRGTLLAVRRTRGTVDFGPAGARPGRSGIWQYPLEELAPAGEEQGCFLVPGFGADHMLEPKANLSSDQDDQDDKPKEGIAT
ncbi:MAG: hypothetical protein NTY19_24020 [Planctomycetota bacterium]|nr:hypothetical protein [Planctomycetota bacterium]